MDPILCLGLRDESLELLHTYFDARNIAFQSVSNDFLSQEGKSLSRYQALLIGEQVDNPIRYAQQAYSYDKSISILLITDQQNQEKIKRALQFSPFIGPTVQCISNATGLRMLPIVEDALERTSQRRSFAKLKSSLHAEQRFTPNVLEKVREDFTAKVLQEAPIGIVLLSANAQVFSINHYALTLFDRSEKEVLGTPVFSLFSESRQEVERFLLDDYLSQPKKVFERQWHGGFQYLELTARPVDMKVSAAYKLLLINDITSSVTKQQQIETQLQELRALNANLARVNADLDTFVYTASHDLKAPILNIEGLVTLLEEELGLGHPCAMELGHIKKSVNSFKKTVEELTDVSRIQKNMDLEVSLIDFVDLIAEIKQLLEKEIQETGAEISLNAMGHTQVFFAKRNLTSVLYNLVSNAIKYRSHVRKPRITLTCWYEGEFFHLSVADNGLGIPANKLTQVFNLFQRMHVHVPGSGVGLYIVKRIVENSGGEISVESQEGEGSVFRLSLKPAAPEAFSKATPDPVNALYSRL